MSSNNHAAPLPPWRPGQPLTTTRINQLVDHANALGSIVGGPGIHVSRSSRSVTISLDAPDPVTAQPNVFPAKITGASSGAHAWTELQPSSSGGFITHPSGRSGTTSSGAAYEVNGRTAVPDNTVVWLMPVMDNSGATQYLFDLGSGNSGSTADMSHSGQHAESASSTTWSINNQSSTRGVTLTIQTGSRYDATASTPTLYAYQRTLSFDASGHLVGVSAESRVVIDTPENCS